MYRRHCAAAAMTLVCAMAVLAAPVQAFAAPAPPSPAPPAEPGKKSLEEVRQEIDGLYRAAGSATDAYNLAEEKAKKQSGEIVKLAQAIVEGQAKIADLKSRAGAQAREQYRNAGLPAGAQLMLSGDPRLFLDGVSRARQGQQATKGLLGELNRTQQDLETYTQDASTNWTKLEANRVKQAKAKKKINEQIAAAKKLESRLEKKERARLLQLEQEAEYKSQTAWLSSGALKEINREASASGKKAVAFATAKIGLPYVGGRGPQVVRLLRADLPGVGVGGPAHPAHLAGAVGAAAAHRDRGHAPRRPDHLPRRRQPCRDVHRRRRDRARPAPRPQRHARRCGLDGDPRRRPPGQVGLPDPSVRTSGRIRAPTTPPPRPPA